MEVGKLREIVLKMVRLLSAHCSVCVWEKVVFGFSYCYVKRMQGSHVGILLILNSKVHRLSGLYGWNQSAKFFCFFVDKNF